MYRHGADKVECSLHILPVTHWSVDFYLSLSYHNLLSHSNTSQTNDGRKRQSDLANLAVQRQV